MKKSILIALAVLSLAVLAAPAQAHFVRGRAFVSGYGFGHATFVAPVYTSAVYAAPVLAQPVVVQPVVQPVVAPVVQPTLAVQSAYGVQPVVAAVGHVHGSAFVVRQRAFVVAPRVQRAVIVRPAAVRVRVRR